jgi:hypothetical protein
MACEVVGIADGSEDAKLRIDTRMRLAKAWNPGRYGDKAEKDSSGITVVVQRGGVVLVGAADDKGYPVQEIAAETGNVIDGTSEQVI